MKKLFAIFVISTTLVACGGNGTTDSTTTIETVVGAHGRIWMDRNLGASRVATSSTDAEAYGDLYQWGRGADGHQIYNSATTTDLSNTDQVSSVDQAGNSSFILAPNKPNDWRNGQNSNLWRGVNGINNPCPNGFRLPTELEWMMEVSSWTSKNSDGAFASPLKLPKAGYRRGKDGSLQYGGKMGLYWSSTVSGTKSRHLVFINVAEMDDYYRAVGLSVRCIKDLSAEEIQKMKNELEERFRN